MSRLFPALVTTPAVSITTDHPLTDADSRSDACPGFHQLSAGLLQLTALRSCRQSTKATTVRPECGHMTHHWHSTYGAHHTSSAVAPLTTGPATDSVQVGGSSPQVSQWPWAPDYLADDCRWTRHRRPGLRSSSEMMLPEVPSTRTTFDDRSVDVDGPRVTVWNSLTVSIHDPPLSITVFSNRLKTHPRSLRFGTDAYLNVLNN